MVATNAPVKLLIEWAFLVRDYQVSGEPRWADVDGFDIETTSSANPRYDLSQPTLQAMFQAVLTARFKLTFHWEAKDLPVYALVPDQQLHLLPGDCAEQAPADTPCPSIRVSKYAQIIGNNATVTNLAMALTAFAGRTVLDKTGISGGYNFTLDWTKYLQSPPSLAGQAPSNSYDPSSVQPAIASALRSELGLKLQADRGPVEILVIDRLEAPSDN